MEFIVKRKDSDDELQHHGIKGQVWGIRNYQTEDGHYTPEGKKRYAQKNQSQRRKVTVEGNEGAKRSPSHPSQRQMIEEIGDEGRKNFRTKWAKKV